LLPDASQLWPAESEPTLEPTPEEEVSVDLDLNTSETYELTESLEAMYEPPPYVAPIAHEPPPPPIPEPRAEVAPPPPALSERQRVEEPPRVKVTPPPPPRVEVTPPPPPRVEVTPPPPPRVEVTPPPPLPRVE